VAASASPAALPHTATRGPGPTVVLLHGLGSCATDWRAQTSALESRYRVVCVDLPGHGASPFGGGAVTVETMAREVAAVLEGPPGDAAHVVGLSLGACVALRLALETPRRVRSLTLVNGFARLQPRGPRDVARLATRLMLLAGAPMTSLAAHVARGLFPRPEQHALYAAAVASLAATSRRSYAAALIALARFDARHQVAAIRRPTLIVAGDRDQTVPLAAKAWLAAAIPGARLAVVPDSGHATPWDQPQAFNRLLLEFLAEH
jgi:3-oxoadipate enol-lactonase